LHDEAFASSPCYAFTSVKVHEARSLRRDYLRADESHPFGDIYLCSYFIGLASIFALLSNSIHVPNNFAVALSTYQSNLVKVGNPHVDAAKRLLPLFAERPRSLWGKISGEVSERSARVYSDFVS
jgi:hypothetical protein